MSDNEDEASAMRYGNKFSPENIKVIAESIGIDSLADDAAKELAETLTVNTKKIVEDAMKFMYHCKRQTLMSSDIDYAVELHGHPLGSFSAGNVSPYNFAADDQYDEFYDQLQEINLDECIAGAASNVPQEMNLQSHWLAIDGIELNLPETPQPPQAEDLPASPEMELMDTADEPPTKTNQLRNYETVYVKQLTVHELSVEQQRRYMQITEDCVGTNELLRTKALKALATDPGVHDMMPYISTFIAEGVKVNVVLKNLAMLIYLMRMVKSLLSNSTLYIPKYLHELIPSTITCIVCAEFCCKPETSNHWALRDYAASIIAHICQTYSNSINNVYTRITRIFSRALHEDGMPLTTIYGSIVGFSKLGSEAIQLFVVPRLKFISKRIEKHSSNPAQNDANMEKIADIKAAIFIRSILRKCCPPVLKKMRNPPDVTEAYNAEYGSIGAILCYAVAESRNTNL